MPLTEVLYHPSFGIPQLQKRDGQIKGDAPLISSVLGEAGNTSCVLANASFPREQLCTTLQAPLFDDGDAENKSI